MGKQTHTQEGRPPTHKFQPQHTQSQDSHYKEFMEFLEFKKRFVPQANQNTHHQNQSKPKPHQTEFPWQEMEYPTQRQTSLNLTDNNITIIDSNDPSLDSINTITFDLDLDLDSDDYLCSLISFDSIQIKNCVYPLECELDVHVDSTPCQSVQTNPKPRRDMPEDDINMVRTSLCQSFGNMNINNVNTNNTTPTDTLTSVLNWDKGTSLKFVRPPVDRI